MLALSRAMSKKALLAVVALVAIVAVALAKR
jgi:hypothetical protein